MAKMIELKLRDVRCFAGEQSGNLARVTLLVGPNSSGKSTFIGCYKALIQLANLHQLDDRNYFDLSPLSMGDFNTIARTKSDTFSLEGVFANHCHQKVRFDFDRSPIGSHLPSGYPREKRILLGWEESQIEISIHDHHNPYLSFETPGFRLSLSRSAISHSQISTWLSRAIKYGHLPYNADPKLFKLQGHKDEDVEAFSKFINFLRVELPLLPEPAFGVFMPVTMQPMPLQRFYESRPNKLIDTDTIDSKFLSSFGRSLKLWEDIHIEASNQQFEVIVHTKAGKHNLQDMGYGIYSVIPWANAFYEKPENTVFLMQHPEVHLHPESQACLAQFIVENEKSCIIETHSDHFLDRFQICVMRGELKPEDLSILYFQPTDNGKSSVIHSMNIDKSGNVLGAPKGYRDFFKRETNDLLGLDS